MVSRRYAIHLVPVFIILVIFFTLSGCHRTSNEKTTNQPALSGQEISSPPVFTPGKVFSSVKIVNAQEHTFSLLLPKGYSRQKKWPVFFIFDPHAAGWLPVEKYASLANRYGYILIGSNQSKNGLPPDLSNRFIRELFEDCMVRFSIDESRVYTMGFSGGAGIAASLARANPSFRGVVACSGGLPVQGPESNFKSDFLGFAGTLDFNLPAMLDMNRQFDKTRVRHHLIVFKGDHEWPDSLTFEDAFYWTVFNEMKDKLIPVDTHIISNFLEKNTRYLQQEKQNQDMTLAYETNKKIVHFLDGLQPVTTYKSNLKTIEENKEFQARQLMFEKKIQEENRQKSSFFQAFTTKDENWWEDEIIRLNREIETATGLQKNSDIRILRFLSLAAYMQAQSAVQKNQVEAGKKFTRLYQLIDPDNPEAWYLSAVLYAKTGQKSTTLSELQLAIEKGFNDYNRMAGENSFSGLMKNRKFRALLDKIKPAR